MFDFCRMFIILGKFLSTQLVQSKTGVAHLPAFCCLNRLDQHCWKKKMMPAVCNFGDRDKYLNLFVLNNTLMVGMLSWKSSSLISQESGLYHGNLRAPPPMPPPKTKALLRDYEPPLSFNRGLIGALFLGGGGIGALDSYDFGFNDFFIFFLQTLARMIPNFDWRIFCSKWVISKASLIQFN